MIKAKKIVLVHGWGATSRKLEGLKMVLELRGWQVINVDLPGFGLPEPTTVWGLAEYSDYVYQQLPSTWKNDGYVYFGHSNGGRIGIKQAEMKKKGMVGLVICAAGGLVRENTWKLKIFKLLAFMGRKLGGVVGGEEILKKLLYKLARVHDYEKASPMMKRVFKKIVDEDVIVKLDKISIKTLVLWGRLDRMVNVKGGEMAAKKIGNLATIHINENAGHRLPYEQQDWVAERINKWF